MRWHNQAADPHIHECARKIAGRFVWIIQAILREEERGDALREAYTVAVEEIEAMKHGQERGEEGR
jgi:hypothetical protein